MGFEMPPATTERSIGCDVFTVTPTQRGVVMTSDAYTATLATGDPSGLVTRRVRRWLTVVLTSSIVVAWSVFLGPHVSRHRKSGRHARTFTSHGNDANVQPNATSSTQMVLIVMLLSLLTTLRYTNIYI